MLPAFADPDVYPLSTMRRAVARRLAEAKQNVPHSYLTIDIDATALVALREQINRELQETAEANPPTEGGELTTPKVTINDLLIKACAVALVRVPACNAQFTPEAILIHRRVDISVAVAVPDGFVTPVVRNADTKTVLNIAEEVRELAARARLKTLAVEEITQGTFSVSNLGMLGIDEFSAVVNPPEGAILAVGRAREAAVVRDGELAVGRRMTLTLSCDHRAVDGAVGAAFLAESAGCSSTRCESLRAERVPLPWVPAFGAVVETPLLRRLPPAMFLALAALSGGACASHVPVPGVQGSRPIALRSFWAGLPAASSKASPGGDVVLRPPLEGRVPVPGGSFTMGSSPVDVERAQLSCEKEPLGVQCADGTRATAVCSRAAAAPGHALALCDRSDRGDGRCVLAVRRERRLPTARPCGPRPAVRPARAACHLCRLGRRRRVLCVGRRTAADRGRVGVRGARSGGAPVSVGRRLQPVSLQPRVVRGRPRRHHGRLRRPRGCGGLPGRATPLGILDLAGNVAEWVSDYYWTDEKGFGYEAASQVNPTGPKFGAFHVVRGGSYLDGAAWLRGASRSPALGPSPTVGFRCAASVR